MPRPLSQERRRYRRRLGWSWIVLLIGELPGPADIAEVVAFLASDRTAFITGEVLNVAVGAYLRNWWQDPDRTGTR